MIRSIPRLLRGHGEADDDTGTVVPVRLVLCKLAISPLPIVGYQALQ